MALLSPYTKRADIGAASSTTVQFAAAGGLTHRPIKLGALSGRIASLTALPTALTISGTAGTRYVYASLAAPSGSAYATLLGLLGGGLLQNLLTNIVATLQALFTGDGSTGIAAILSSVTFVESASATPPDTHHVPLGQIEVAAGIITSLTSYENQVEVTVSAFIHGQCELTFPNPNIRLIPKGGASLVIDGTARSVPSGGVDLAPTGLTPDTLYRIYASWSGSAIVLEASTTGHTLHTNGVRIKSGDATRTLVGLVFVLAGPVFYGLVRTWFNDRGRAFRATITADAISTSTGAWEALGGGVAGSFVSVPLWAEETVEVYVAGEASNGSAGGECRTGIGVGSTTVAQDGVCVAESQDANDRHPVAVRHSMENLGEKMETFYTLVQVSAGTGTWEGTTTPRRLTIGLKTGGSGV